METFEGKQFIPRQELVDGAYYYGHCRNARVARWDAASGKFYYWREKCGKRFIASINGPEDDNGFDLFFAQEEINIAPINVEGEKP